MRDITKQSMLRSFPELKAQLHLPHYARVLRRPDAPEDGGTCERFRPRYAVDLQILTPDYVVDPRFPVYEAVPVPVPAGGHEQGWYGLPDEGTLVTLQFVYGRPDHPVIQQIYPMGCELPAVDEMEHSWSKSGTVFQKVDKNGNWQRFTDQTITDESVTIVHRAIDSIEMLTRKLTRVTEHSTEEIGGTKRIESFGAMKLLTAGHSNVSAGGNLNLTTASNFNETVSRNRYSVTGQNEATTVKGNATHTVKGNELETIGGNHTVSITGKATRTVGGDYSDTVDGSVTTKAGSSVMHSAVGTYTISAPGFLITSGEGGGGVSLLNEITDCMEDIRDALKVIAAHTHPHQLGDTGAPKQSGSITGYAKEVDRHKGRIEGIMG